MNVGRGSANDYTTCLRNELSGDLPNLVVCLLARNTADTYNAIKKVCYVQFGGMLLVINVNTTSSYTHNIRVLLLYSAQSVYCCQDYQEPENIDDLYY